MAVITYDSEKALEDALNAGSISPDFILAKGGKFTAAEALWNPSKLASADRTLLSEWNVQKGVTIDTGVSELSDQIGSNDFIQPITSAQPPLSGTGTDTVITYDSIADYLYQPVTNANFQDLTRFEWWGAVLADSNNQYIASFQDQSTVTDYIYFSIESSNDLKIISRENAGANSGCRTTNALGAGWHIVGFVCDGSAYKIYVDGVSVALDTIVSNVGIFIGDNVNKANFDLASTGAIITSSTYFSAYKQKLDLCFGGTTDDALSTEAERTNIANYINETAGLGLTL